MDLGDVLFAVDFSETSRRAARVAMDLARESGVRLHLVHVVPPVTDPADAPVELKRLAAEAATEGVRVETAVLSGRVARGLVGYARDKRVGLIVLGTHGRTGFSHAVLGSVAEAVVRLAACPVLTIPAVGADEAAVGPEPPSESHHCIVCNRTTDDLICERCRTRIRAEALESKLAAERPGRRGSPA